MMVKKVYSIFFLFMLFAVHSSVRTAYAQPAVSSTELINNGKAYDGKCVIYTGEAIGDVMLRDTGAWVNVSDGKSAVGIWMSKDLAGDIQFSGSYKSTGDIVEIKGVFHYACPEHGGDLDIHAQSLRKLKSGGPVAEHWNKEKKNLSAVLLGALCLVLILRRFKPKSKP